MIPFRLSSTALILAPLFAAGCAAMSAPQQQRPEKVFAVTGANKLVSFNAGSPGTVRSWARITGLADGETVASIDFRPANGKLYAVTTTGRLYTIDTASGGATRVGTADTSAFMKSKDVALNFNPTVDRIRLVGAAGENMRLHPDTGAIVDANPNQDGVQLDGALAYAGSDMYAGRKPVVTGTAYTNSVPGAKGTTNFAVDSSLGVLVTQGTREGTPTPVSPNTGQLYTVGPLGVKTVGPVAFDIAAATNAAFASIVSANGKPALYEIDLRSGAATMIGVIGSGEPVRALAVAP